MATDAAWELQKALVTKIAADAPTIALLAGGAASIYDDVSESAHFPFITVGQIESDAWETNTELGQEHAITINVWSSRDDRAGGTEGYEGRKEARDIVGALHTALNRASLTIAGFTCVNLTYIFSDVFRDSDNTYHGVIRFRAVTEPS